MQPSDVVWALFIVLFKASTGSDVIQGLYHALWVPLPLPRTVVQRALPDKEFTFNHSSIPGLPADHELVLFEMGRENDCGPIIFPASFRKDFMEFKFDIPYLKHTKLSRLFNNKQIIYVDSEIESIGAREVYKLNSSVADVSFDSTSYTVAKNGATLMASYTPNGDWENPVKYQNFKLLANIFSQRWFGDRDFHTCADHHYDFAHALVRPVQTNLSVNNGILSYWFPIGHFRIPSITEQPFGGVEIWVNWTMTSPLSCQDE